MKINAILPWICVLGISAGMAALYVKDAGKDEELAKLRDQNKELQQLRTELSDTKEQFNSQTEEISGLRKEKQELLSLRNEIGKLREDRQQIAKQLAAAKSESERAQSEVSQIRAGVQQVQNENQQLRTTVGQNQQNAQLNACINNLRQLDAAKQQWALENQKNAEATPSPRDIMSYLNNSFPVCPAGGTYVLNKVGQLPTCSMPGHALPR
jgi:uncharacterized protein (DUF3084 family)